MTEEQLEKSIETGESLVIDCDAQPRMFDNFLLGKHDKLGKIVFDQNKIGLYITEKQKNGSYIIGEDLIGKEIPQGKFLNANYLDWLWLGQNRKHIPDDWFGKDVFFLGTIFRARSKYRECGGRYVYTRHARYLRCSHKTLRTGLFPLKDQFGEIDYMAILK